MAELRQKSWTLQIPEAEDQLAELADLLAQGTLRLRQRHQQRAKSSQTQDFGTENSLDCEAKESGGVPPKCLGRTIF